MLKMQKRVRTIGIVCFVLLSCMFFVFAACKAVPEITKITLDKDVLSMQTGDEATLTATVDPADSASAVVWTCDKDTVVKVENGKVTALSAGTAVVSAQNKKGTIYASCTVIVTEKLNSVTLDKKTMEMYIDEEQTLKATADPASFADKLVWKCSPVGIVNVENGKVTALSAGTATVTVTDQQGVQSDSCTVTVYAKAEKIELDKTATDMYVGGEQSIVATVTPQGTKAVEFVSSNTEVATVDGEGVITAVKAGTANITAKLDGIETTCVVTVYEKATVIDLGVQEITLYGGTYTLNVVTTPADNVKAPQFTSDNEDVATVDGEGVITAVKAGTATITATIDDVTATVNVTVVTVAFENKNYSLKLNAEQQLTLTIAPETVSVEGVTYTSSAADIVSVDEGGKVKAKAYGQAVITASADGKFGVTCTVTVSPLATEDGASVEYGENGYAIKAEQGLHANALNLGENAASKVYYAEYTLSGMNLYPGQAKSFGLAHFAASDNLMIDVYHMYLGSGDVTGAGYWHRMNSKLDTDNGISLDQYNAGMGKAVYDGLIDMLKNGTTVKMGVARNGDDIYTLFNGKIVYKTTIADKLKEEGTVPAIIMNATGGDSRKITDVVYYSGEAAITKLNETPMSVNSITFKDTDAAPTLIKGEEKTLTVTVDPSYAAARLVWTSDNADVVSVDQTGKITAKAIGTATITATIDGVKAEAVVTVVDYKFEKQNYSLELNGVQTLSIVSGDGNAVTVNEYKTSNADIVSIDTAGNIEAKAYGKVTVTAVIGSIEITCTVTVSPLMTETGVTVTYKEDGTFDKINVLEGKKVNAVNTGAQPSKVYYAEYTLSGLTLGNYQAKAFGFVHSDADGKFMFDEFNMWLNTGTATDAGYWHRMGNTLDSNGELHLEDGLLLNQANSELGMVHDWIIAAIQENKSIKMGVARNGNYIYTFINNVIVLQTTISDELKGADTAPAMFMSARSDESRTVDQIVFLNDTDAVNKIDGATRLLRYSRVADSSYKPATIEADSSSFRFGGADSSDAAWRASVTQEAVFGANATIDMDIKVHNTADGHIGINITKNDGNGRTSRNNFSDGLTLAGYWMWTKEGKQQGIDYFKDGATGWTDNVDKFWLGGPADVNKSGSFHINIKLSRNEDGTVKSVMTLTNGDTLMQTIEKTSVNTHSADEVYRIHFLTDKIDYEVSNLKIVEN